MEDKVDSAEDCLDLDLPPIAKFIPDKIPDELEKTHEKIFKKLEQYSHINTNGDESDPILFETRVGKRRKEHRKLSTKKPVLTEIIQETDKLDENPIDVAVYNAPANEYDTSSTLMDISLFSNRM